MHHAAEQGSLDGMLGRARWLLALYKRCGSETFRRPLRRCIVQWEGGPAFSLTIREILWRYHGLHIGAYSHWPWREKPGVFHRGTLVGRYCWIADTVRTFTRNHPSDLLSTHGFFYNPEMGKVSGAALTFGELEIGHGAWLGHNVIVVPPTRRIGVGAVVQPGSVVCMDVPDYAVVSGFPARVVGWRISKAEIAACVASRWWERSPRDLFETVSGRPGEQAAQPAGHDRETER